MNLKAIIASIKSGSLSNLQKLAVWANDCDEPQPHLLPVFLHHLDKDKIPQTHFLSVYTYSTIKLAQVSLQGIAAAVLAQGLGLSFSNSNNEAFTQAAIQSMSNVWVWVEYLNMLFFEKPTTSNIKRLQRNVIVADSTRFILVTHLHNKLSHSSNMGHAPSNSGPSSIHKMLSVF